MVYRVFVEKKPGLDNEARELLGEARNLQGLDLRVDEGELMAIVGNSGSGKSTFLNMIGGLDRPSAGRLMVMGRDLFKMNERELNEYKRHDVGFVWQNNARNLLPYLSARQNVELPMLFEKAGAKRARAMELLELVGMAHRKNHRLNQMSGGEQQRVAIAIALANRAKILLADEPTGSVDVKTSAYILDVFRRINREMGVTVVIVTHDRQLAGKVDRVVSIRDGKISSERIMRRSYRERMQEIGGFAQENGQDEAPQDEFSVLDRAGRLQIPKELLERLNVQDSRVRVEYRDGRIVIEQPQKKS